MNNSAMRRALYSDDDYSSPFITLLLDSFVVRIRPRNECDTEPIARMRSIDGHAACHSIRLELKRVNLVP